MPTFGTKTLATATAVAVTNTGTPATGLSLFTPPNGITFTLDVTSAATDAVDTLDVYVQTLVGSKWTDVVHFTQVVGNGGVKCHVNKIAQDQAQAVFEASASLAAGSVRNIIGDSWRVRWDITDANANAAFTFTVNAVGF